MTIETDNDVAKHLRNYRKAIHNNDSYAVFAVMIDAWNWATAPYVARGEKSHRACSRFARKVNNLINLLDLQIEEYSNGMKRLVD